MRRKQYFRQNEVICGIVFSAWQKFVKPALDEVFVLIENYSKSLKPSDYQYFKKSLNYALNFKERFFAAVDDPEMPFTNSVRERTFAFLGMIRSNCKQIGTCLGFEACTL